MDICDDIVVLNFGEVIFTGEPEAARRHRGVVDAYLGQGEDDLVGVEAEVV